MPWTRLKYAPGINKEHTRYAADGTWYDGNLVRFRDGYPEMWGGWVRTFTSLTMQGICRSMFRFSDLSGFQWMGLGTSQRFYVASDDLTYEVSPISSTATLGTNPLSTTNGSAIITIHHAAHGHVVGDDLIITGALTTNGIPASEINATHSITAYISPDDYQITVTTAATSTGAGGGNAVVIQYIFEAGSEDQIYGGGWGSSSWGEDPWGGDGTGGSGTLGVWSMDNWGEDLVANAAKGPIFYWTAAQPDARMKNIRDIPGADGNAPDYSEFILISHKDRHLLSFGSSEFGTGIVKPMSFRWCDQEDITNWNEADLQGTAGSLPLSQGSRFVAAIATQSEIVAWTDQAVYSIQYLGAPLIYGAELISDFADIVGLNAACVSDSTVFWMGRSGIYSYSGRIEKIPCTVWDYVSKRIDFTQATKVYASTNSIHDELLWFYPSTDQSPGEVDSYLAYDVKENVWSIGSLARTCWTDLDTLNNPFAASVDGKIYIHEVGADDGSTDPVTALPAYIESAPLELSSEGSYDKGDKFMFIRRILPDITFRDYSDGVNTPRVNFNLKMMDKPGGGFNSTSSSQASRSVILPVEEFTEELHVRIRGRSLTLRIDGSNNGTQWRLGIPRIDVRTDGQR